MMLWVILAVIIVFGLFFTWALMRVTAQADERQEEVMKELKKINDNVEDYLS